MPNSTVLFHLFTVQAYWGRGSNNWTVRADGNRKREILGRLGSSPCVSNPQMYNSEICPGRNYLDVVHIFQQLRKGVDLHQGDNLSDGGCLRLSRFIYHRTQCRQFKVAMFLRKRWRKGISQCKPMLSSAFYLEHILFAHISQNSIQCTSWLKLIHTRFLELVLSFIVKGRLILEGTWDPFLFCTPISTDFHGELWFLNPLYKKKKTRHKTNHLFGALQKN